MATVGTREVNKKNAPKPSDTAPLGLRMLGINLTIGAAKVQPVTTVGYQPSALGSPIMRDDFITTTGFMPPKNEV
jgi:hypothetical protein